MNGVKFCMCVYSELLFCITVVRVFMNLNMHRVASAPWIFCLTACAPQKEQLNEMRHTDALCMNTPVYRRWRSDKPQSEGIPSVNFLLHSACRSCCLKTALLCSNRNATCWMENLRSRHPHSVSVWEKNMYFYQEKPNYAIILPKNKFAKLGGSEEDPISLLKWMDMKKINTLASLSLNQWEKFR